MTPERGALVAALVTAVVMAACGGPLPSGTASTALYGAEVVRFAPGPGAGFGQDGMPGVVLGPPHGRGVSAGSLDVVSLGAGGIIVLSFGGTLALDGPGADLLVSENAFYAGGDPERPWAEPGEVAVSLDGEVWHAFPCDPKARDGTGGPGCAGRTPGLAYDAQAVTDLDPAVTGGDAFDLADLALPGARYIRIVDMGGQGTAPTAGFDLDAVAARFPADSED